jgi:DNA-binding response OmpR family regulator
VDVSNGEEAMQYSTGIRFILYVVQLDVMMRAMDGFEVCRRMREMNASVGIIMLTAKGQEMDKVYG